MEAERDSLRDVTFEKLQRKYVGALFPPQPECEICGGTGEYLKTKASVLRAMLGKGKRLPREEVAAHNAIERRPLSLCICCVVDPVKVAEFVDPDYDSRRAKAKETRRRNSLKRRR